VSVTEKLKALAVSKAIDWPAPSYEAWRLAEDAERLRKNAIADALPELISVVKAAGELVRDVPSRLALERGAPNEFAAEVDRALAALDAKLGEAG